jgi:hypothetical protein
LTLPESTRWLTKKGRHDEAWESLQWIRAGNSQTTVDEMEEIRAGVAADSIATEGFQFKGKKIACPSLNHAFVNSPKRTATRR